MSHRPAAQAPLSALAACCWAMAWVVAAEETAVEQVSGHVYVDANGNGRRDAGEQPLTGVRVTDSVGFASTGDDGAYTVTTDPAALGAVRDALEAGGYAIASAELTLVPKQAPDIDDEEARKLLKLVDALEDDDDVQDVVFDAEIPDAVLAEQ